MYSRRRACGSLFGFAVFVSGSSQLTVSLQLFFTVWLLETPTLELIWERQTVRYPTILLEKT